MHEFLKIGKGNGTMCISRDSDHCTGNYICEVGGGIKRWEGGRGKKKWRNSSRSHVFRLSQKQVWIWSMYVNEEISKLPLLCFWFVLKMLVSSPEVVSLK